MGNISWHAAWKEKIQNPLWMTFHKKTEAAKTICKILTLSLSTLPWKNRKRAESAKSGRDPSMSLWAASEPERRLDPSNPKNGRTIVWNHRSANLYVRITNIWRPYVTICTQHSLTHIFAKENRVFLEQCCDALNLTSFKCSSIYCCFADGLTPDYVWKWLIKFIDEASYF